MFLIGLTLALLIIIWILIRHLPYGDVTFVDFAHLLKPKTPNYALKPFEEGAPLHLSAEKAKALTKAYMAKQRARLLQENAQQQVYLCRSFVFAFPDLLFIEFQEIEAKRTQVAVFSHAIYGVSDFKVNQKRLDKLVRMLKEARDDGL